MTSKTKRPLQWRPPWWLNLLLSALASLAMFCSCAMTGDAPVSSVPWGITFLAIVGAFSIILVIFLFVFIFGPFLGREE